MAMSETGKHTEGPWIRRDTQDYAEIVGADRVVAMVARGVDADLIAAAPDMMALLKLALGDTEYVLSKGFWDEVRAVIAKATGTP